MSVLKRKINKIDTLYIHVYFESMLELPKSRSPDLPVHIDCKVSMARTFVHKRKDTLFRGGNCQKLFCLSSEKGSTLQAKNLLPLGADLFFRRGLVSGKTNRKSQN